MTQVWQVSQTHLLNADWADRHFRASWTGVTGVTGQRAGLKTCDLTTLSVTGAGVRTGVPTLSVNARLLTTLSITSVAGLLITLSLVSAAAFRTGIAGGTGVAGLGSGTATRTP